MKWSLVSMCHSNELLKHSDFRVNYLFYPFQVNQIKKQSWRFIHFRNFWKPRPPNLILKSNQVSAVIVFKIGESQSFIMHLVFSVIYSLVPVLNWPNRHSLSGIVFCTNRCVGYFISTIWIGATNEFSLTILHIFRLPIVPFDCLHSTLAGGHQGNARTKRIACIWIQHVYHISAGDILPSS